MRALAIALLYWQFSWVQGDEVRESPFFYLKERCEYARELVRAWHPDVTDCHEVVLPLIMEP